MVRSILKLIAFYVIFFHPQTIAISRYYIDPHEVAGIDQTLTQGDQFKICQVLWIVFSVLLCNTMQYLVSSRNA